QQHAHAVVQGVGRDDVGPAVLVDIRQCHRDGSAAGGEGWGEEAPPLPQQHTDAVVRGVSGDDVEPAIPVDVRQCQRADHAAGVEVLGCGEGAVAVGQLQAHASVAPVGRDDVGPTVTVDVARDVPQLQQGGEAGGEVLACGEGAAALAQQHAHAVTLIA